ncbi:nitronate monooxygenase [Brachybacterium paraconglomeratum]|uniref:nitronate monooxygenase n=1 Tax=Brachybacterium paraconglomeratum TaxID=173362 RepID=UPI0031EC07FE
MTAPLLDSPLPIVAAPMAGGPSTIALARAVASAGAFPFLPGGYKTPDALAGEIDQVRRIGTEFGVNLFVPSHAEVDDAEFAAYADELTAEAAAHGLELDPTPVVDDDGWRDKLALLITDPVPVVSLMFGLPDPADIAALQKVGTRVLATVTNAGEARRAHEAGVDGLVVQGAAAGGHSAIFDPAQDPEPIATDTLVRRVLEAVDLPVIAGGGVNGPHAVRQLLDAGAQAVVVGTMLLRTDEAGTSPTHRSALGDPAFTETVLTRAFTGRPARSLRNGFTDRHPRGITANPAVHHLTRALRQAAGRSGDTDRMHLWAGTGWRSATTGSAADVIRQLAEGA